MFHLTAPGPSKLAEEQGAAQALPGHVSMDAGEGAGHPCRALCHHPPCHTGDGERLGRVGLRCPRRTV